MREPTKAAIDAAMSEITQFLGYGYQNTGKAVQAVLSEQAATAINDAIRYDKRIQEQAATIEELGELNAEGNLLRDMIADLRKQLSEQAATIERLEAELRRLRDLVSDEDMAIIDGVLKQEGIGMSWYDLAGRMVGRSLPSQKYGVWIVAEVRGNIEGRSRLVTANLQGAQWVWTRSLVTMLAELDASRSPNELRNRIDSQLAGKEAT